MTQTPDAKIAAIAPWFGGKRTLAPRIARECCREDARAPKSFWDLGCGSMAVSLAMPRCSHHHAVDLHDQLLTLARVIQSRHDGPRFYRHLRRVLNHEALFHEARARADQREGLFGASDDRSDLERAIDFFIVAWQGRNGVAGTARTNYQPAIRWTSGGGHGATRFRGAVASIPAWRRRMSEITIVKRDLFDVLTKLEDQEGTSIYIDPPYLHDGARSGSCQYEHDFSWRDHERLRDKARRFKKARVVVSYYDHPWLREAYAGWTFVEAATQKNLHVQNRRGVGRCEAPEVLIINGPSYTARAGGGEGAA